MSPKLIEHAQARVEVGGIALGSAHPIRVIAGPCSVESLEQFRTTAQAVHAAGAVLLRGGAFKPRTSPYSFQGLACADWRSCARWRTSSGWASPPRPCPRRRWSSSRATPTWCRSARETWTIGSLLEAAAASGRPILLKRGITATVDEVLAAAEYIVVRGNDQVVICERGSRTFEPSTRNSLDIAAVSELKLRSDLPVIVDPSHGTGVRDLVAPVALAGIAAGADGVMVEVHPQPDAALSDGFQSLEAAAFPAFMSRVRAMAMAMGRAV